MKKSFFKLFVLMICAFSMCMNVKAASYTYYKKTYCYNADGTYGKTLNVTDTTCSGYYSGTVLKKINGTEAYCTQNNTTMSFGKSCSNVTKYNSKSWMNGHWTEKNAIRLGYAMQYIKSKKYAHDAETVYIVNIANQMLQFKGSSPKRNLNSKLTKAIAYGNNSYNKFKESKVISKSSSSINAGFTSNVLTDVNGYYSKGEINLRLVNGSPVSKMTVTADCTNCTLYADSNFTKKFTNVVVKASRNGELKLYVKSNNNLAANTKVSVKFTGTFDSVTYPIAKLWNCGDTAQSLVTLDSSTVKMPAKTSTVDTLTPVVKKYCQVYAGKYYGKDGSVVTETKYREDCMPKCKVVNGKYFGKNGTEVTVTKYREDCLSICKIVNGKYFGKNGTEVTVEKYREECLPVCKIVNGKYFGKNGTEVTVAKYKEECMKICKIENGKYYGKNGTEVTVEKYKEECLPICKVENGKYYGKNGTEVTEDKYREDCLKVCKIENGKYYGKNGTEVTVAKYREDCLPICKIENGKYYGKNGDEVTEDTYKEDCLKVCKVEDDKYYGKDGTEVTEDKYREDCLPICKIEDGKYYGKNGNEVTDSQYRDECLKICKVEDGKYYGKNGNEVTDSQYRDECLKICKIDNGKYYGENGDEVTGEQYRSQCLPSDDEVNVPSTGTTASNVPFALGLSAIVAGLGIVSYKKKKMN